MIVEITSNLHCAQVEFTTMREQYMRCGEGFMICYSVTDLHSFQEIMEYKKLISRVRANEEIPVVLVGNKFDLQQRRKVPMDFSGVLTTYTFTSWHVVSLAGEHWGGQSVSKGARLSILWDFRCAQAIRGRRILFAGEADPR